MSLPDAVADIMANPGKVDALEDDMVNLVRDLRSARHARHQQSDGPANELGSAVPPFPHAAAATSLPASSWTQPTSALQAAAAARWMSTSGVTAATPVARAGTSTPRAGSSGAGSKQGDASVSSSLAGGAPPPSTPRFAGAACTTASRAATSRSVVGRGATSGCGVGVGLTTPASGASSSARGFRVNAPAAAPRRPQPR